MFVIAAAEGIIVSIKILIAASEIFNVYQGYE
jgi:hypothetical protein